MTKPRFEAADGGVAVEMTDEEWGALAAALDQFRELLMMDSDPNLVRLEPPARPDDPEAEQKYREMVSDQLLQNRLEAIERVEAAQGRAVLDDEATAAWMQTLNGMRLYLGERLGVSDDPEAADENHPDRPAVMLYQWIGWLLEQLIAAASEGLEDPPYQP